MRLEAYLLTQSDRKKVKWFRFFSFSPCTICACTTSYGIGLNLIWFGFSLHLFDATAADASRVRIEVSTTIYGGGEVTIIQAMTLEELATLTLYAGSAVYPLQKRSRIMLTVIEPNQPTEGESE